MMRKSGASINLLSFKSTKGAAILNVPFRRTNRYQQYLAFTSYVLRRDLGFNPDIFGTKTSDRSSTPPSLLIPVPDINSRPAYAFILYALRRDLRFNPDIFGKKLAIEVLPHHPS